MSGLYSRGLWASAGLILLTLTGCASDPVQPLRTPIVRILPAVDSVVLFPVQRPDIEEGDDVRLLARRALDYGDENARRLEQARVSYTLIAQRYASQK